MKRAAVGKNNRRLARAAQTRRRQKRLGMSRLLVHVTGKHTYAQIVAPDDTVTVSASSAEKEMRASLGKSGGGNVAAAKAVGARLAQKTMKLDETKRPQRIAFDRGGRKYHGRVRTLAEAAREGGLHF